MKIKKILKKQGELYKNLPSNEIIEKCNETVEKPETLEEEFSEEELDIREEVLEKFLSKGTKPKVQEVFLPMAYLARDPENPSKLMRDYAAVTGGTTSIYWCSMIQVASLFMAALSLVMGGIEVLIGEDLDLISLGEVPFYFALYGILTAVKAWKYHRVYKEAKSMLQQPDYGINAMRERRKKWDKD